MQFTFATAGEILFGAGVLEQGAIKMKELGKRYLVVTGGDTGRAAPLTHAMLVQGLETVLFSVAGEPSVPVVEQGARVALTAGCDAVVGFGGGSAMDAAKAIAAKMTNAGELLQYMEVIGDGQPLENPAAPCVAVPTTAGTGAEVTRNAVLVSLTDKVKVSLRHKSMLPRLAIVDPELTVGMPPSVTASTGLDALTQLMEAYVSRKATPITDGFCMEGLVRAARSLPVAWENGSDLAAREAMHLASLFSGLALANGGLGAVHGLAAPLGGALGAPHGMICAAVLPHALRANIRALQKNASDSWNVRILGRFQELATIVTGSASATAEDGADWVAALCSRFGVKGLGEMGLSEDELDAMTAKGQRASSMKGNPIALSDAAVRGILESSL